MPSALRKSTTPWRVYGDVSGAQATRFGVPRLNLKFKERPERRIELLLAAPVDERDHSNNLATCGFDKTDYLANAATCGDDIFNDQNTSAGGHLERPAKHHAPLLAFAEDELDPQSLRDSESDHESAHSRGSNNIDRKALRQPLDCGLEPAAS